MSGHYVYDQSKYRNATAAIQAGAATWVSYTPVQINQPIQTATPTSTTTTPRTTTTQPETKIWANTMTVPWGSIPSVYQQKPIEPIPEVKIEQHSIVDKIISIPSNFISSLQTGYTVLQNPKIQEKLNENINRFLMKNVGWIINPEQFQLAYNVYTGTGESPDVIYERNYQAYKKLFEKKDIGGIGLRVVQSPLPQMGLMYFGALGLGGFAATKIGQTAAFNIGKFAITPSLALNVGVGTVFSAGMVKSGYTSFKEGNIKPFLGTTALSLPFFMIPFKAGYTKGGGYVQRTGALSTVTDATQRTQQKAIYDMMKTTEKLHEPYLDQKPYDITQVKETPSLPKLEQFLQSPVSKIIRKPAIGGSTAMDIQMREFFRKGGYPERALEIARERQSQTPDISMRNVPLKTSGTPGDIDILLGGKFATESMADFWSHPTELGTHVHVSKPNTEYWGGYSTKPFTKSLVSFTGEPVSVKTLSVREQFLRYGHSVLPSNIMEKSYRAYKDVPGFYDTFDVLQFQKGGTKLNEAMDRFLNPSGYKSPKVTIGETIIKGIGGATKISEDWSYGSSNLGYLPSYISSPKINNLLYGTDTYTKPNYISTSYVNKGFEYQPSYTSTVTDYKGYGVTPDIPTYNPPYISPSYTPPPYEPPYIPPPYYPPKYYPNYTPPPPPPNKTKYPFDSIDKELKKFIKGYNIFIKERHYFKGKKKKPTTWFKANVSPLTKEQALALGATAVDRSAAAAFKILPTEGQPRQLRYNVESWNNLAGNYYEKNGAMIERTAHRINTSGEVKGISALGWLAQRQKASTPMKIKYTPVEKNVKPMKIGKPINVNININKIMRGWKL